MMIKNWMSLIPDHVSLSRMSIPGTHDSATYSLKSFSPALVVPVVPFGYDVVQFAQTQDEAIQEQLELGIRFLDLRVKLVDHVLLMYHDFVPLGLTLSEMFRSIHTFLEANPSETVLTCIKHESGDAGATNEALITLIEQGTPKFYTDDRIPTLGDVRGKAVLLSRTTPSVPSRKGQPFGIFIGHALPETEPQEHSEKQVSGHELKLAVQDVYSPSAGFFGSTATAKKGHIEQAYRRFKTGTYDLRLNFVSATAVPTRTPRGFADVLNPKIEEILFHESGGAPWITILDYVGVHGSGMKDPIAAVASVNDLSAHLPADRRSELHAGQEMAPNTELYSPSGGFMARFQTDGNFVVYRVVDGAVMKATGTDGKGATRAAMQHDGNFVVYKGNEPLASTGSHTAGDDCRLVMQDDGNLVIYDAGGHPVWASRSSRVVGNA